MSRKGRTRKAWAAMAMRKRNPEAWFPGPVVAVKVKKNRVLALLPKRRGERGRDA